jgi:tRNA(Ile)-lysidine synthase
MPSPVTGPPADANAAAAGGPALAAVARALAAVPWPRPPRRIVVAVSGGLDSVALLDLLVRLQHRFGLHLQVAHFDHGLRAEGPAEADFVRALAQSLGLACTCAGGDVAGLARRQRLSVETAARQARYGFLDRVATTVGAAWVALGHHADDQAETVVMRLARGAGATGLAAMAPVREGRYLRPLLALTRRQLADYAAERGLQWCEDASNADLRYTRNRVRHGVMPALRQLNPAVSAALGRTAVVLGDEDQLLNDWARQALQRALRPGPVPAAPGRHLVLDAPLVVSYHLALQRRALRAGLEGLGLAPGAATFGLVEQLRDALVEPPGPPRSLVRGLAAQRLGSWLVIGTTAPVPLTRDVAMPGVTAVPEHGARLVADVLPADRFAALRPSLGGARAAVDAASVAAGVTLRRPRPGDRLRPLGMIGTRKVSDLLIDSGYPRMLRHNVLVATRRGPDGGEELVWLLGQRVAEPCRVGPHTRQFVLLEWQALE